MAFAPLGRLEIGAPAPDFRAPAASGGRFRLASLRGRPVVLEWTSPVCPYTAKKYDGGAMQALQRAVIRRGVGWVSVNTAAVGRPGALTPAAARARIAAVGAKVTAFVLDDGAVGRLYGARVTPSVVLIGRDGRLAYQGAVDDDPWASGADSLGWLRDALADLLAGRPQRRPETRPYGCPVEY